MDPFFVALLLYCLALVLAFVDLFIPSGGMLLIMATAAALGAVLFGFRSGSTMGMTMLTIVVATVPVFAYAAIKIWPNTPLGKRIILSLPNHAKPVAQATSSPVDSLVGSVHQAESALMPTGQLRIGHRYFNAVAETGIVEAGQNVEIVEFKERNLVVRITDAEPNLPGQKSAEARVDDHRSLLDLPADELGIDSLDQ